MASQKPKGPEEKKAEMDKRIGINYEILQKNYKSFQNAMTNYIKSGGINMTQDDSNNPLFNKAYQEWSNLQKLLKDYQDLNKEFTELLKQESDASDVVKSLQEFEEKKHIHQKLSSTLEEKKAELDIAKSRQESIPNASTEQSYVQGISGKLGFTRPIKKLSVSVLLGLSFLMLVVSSLILKDFFMTNVTTNMNVSYSSFDPQTIFGVSQTTLQNILGGVSIVFILFAASLIIYKRYFN